jgi:hypothetical protein
LDGLLEGGALGCHVWISIGREEKGGRRDGGGEEGKVRGKYIRE